MLINITDYIKRSSVLNTPYKGVVVDNNDPKKLGRVKCNIEGLLEGSSEKLPWITQRNFSLLGGGKGSFGVPKIGSTLTIIFPFDDIYAGEYHGYWTDTNTKITLFDTDYPNSFGLDDGDFSFIHNRNTQKTTINHPSGAVITIDQDGKVEILADKIDLGDVVTDAIIKGDAFKQYFDTHVHPTAVGPSGPPNAPMPPSTLSTDVKVK